MFVENFPAIGTLRFEAAVVTRSRADQASQFHDCAGISARSILPRGFSVETGRPRYDLFILHLGASALARIATIDGYIRVPHEHRCMDAEIPSQPVTVS